jgi:hypothetical protein
MGPAEAAKAHIDLGTPLSIAAHFQVFRLGIERFDDAVKVLVASLMEQNLKPDTFVAPVLGQAIKIPPVLEAYLSPADEDYLIGLILGFPGASRSEIPEAFVRN